MNLDRLCLKFVYFLFVSLFLDNCSVGVWIDFAVFIEPRQRLILQWIDSI